MRLDFEKWYEYIQKNESDIRGVFGSKRMNLEEEYSEDYKQSISQYIQPKLREMLGITIKATYKGSLTYLLETWFDLSC